MSNNSKALTKEQAALSPINKEEGQEDHRDTPNNINI